MNLIFRLLWITLTLRFKSPVTVLGPCSTPFRCWFTDLDVLRHMNNGKYFSLMDLARVDLMGRSGVLAKLQARGYYPVVVAETMKFKKSIQPLQKFEIVTSVIGWDEKAFLVKQEFVAGGTLYAEAVVRARFLKKSGGSVSPREVVELGGITDPSPELDSSVKIWNELNR